jgi:oligopeptide transport system permease protein
MRREYFLMRSWRVKIAISLLLLVLCFALFAPLFSRYTYDQIHLDHTNAPPSSSFWFGTDELGRDLFIRSAMGARISLSVALSAVLIDLLIGVLWGSIAALNGKRLDELLMRSCDILQSIPSLLMVLLLTLFLGPGFFTILAAIALTGWITMARIIRSHLLQVKELPFILAAESLGASRSRLLFLHLIPNAAGPILVTLTLNIPSAILAEAFLSFLGVGIQAPISSWGVMLNDGLGSFRYFPWRIFFPALLLTVTIFSFNLLGESLRNYYDPTTVEPI